MYTLDTIKNFDKLYLDFFNKCDNIKSKYQDKDVRLSFYYLSYQNIDAAIHMLVFNLEDLNEENLLRIYQATSIKNRFDGLSFPTELRIKQMRTNFEQFIANQYSLSIFCLFEHSFRTLVKQIYPNDYRRNEKSFITCLSFS